MPVREIVVVVGGGVYVPALCEALARDPSLPPLDLRIVGRGFERAAVIAAHSAARMAALRPDWRVHAEPSLEPACAGASAVILLVRVGGATARHHDEQFPARFGLVGDEGLGPGGFANAWRSFPVLADIAHLVGKHAPDATVLNLVAPLGMTTRWCLEQGLDAVGLCELPTLTRRRLGPGPWCYAGLNHLGWFWRPRGDVEPEPPPAAVGCDREVWDRFGAVPLAYYYRVFDLRAGARIGVRAPSGRAMVLGSLSARVLSRYAERPGAPVSELDERPTPWFDEVVAPVLATRFGGPLHDGYANVVNRDRLPFLPAGVVVELEARFSATGIEVRSPAHVPRPVSEFLARAAAAEDLAYRAARARRTDLLADALCALPLDVPAARLDELVEATTTPMAGSP
jgi:6-phospho-beta-glucosidase